jgi:cytochrome oxidase Cu insertion factor (SCO1/SenC/PrrC family)
VSKTLIALAFAGGIAAGGTSWWLAAPSPEPPQRSAAELMDVVMWNKEPIGGPFSLIDHTGKPRTDADFRGKLLLVYFGFSYCSDVCPTDLQAIATAVDKLGPSGDLVQPLFITVDPEKDTPEQLKGYVGLFHPRLIGLTGEVKQIRRVANVYKVYFAKTDPEKWADPSIDHFGFVFLMDAAGKYVGFFPPGTPPNRMADVIRPLVEAAHPL